MPKVSANKVRAFVEKARMGKYKTPDNEPNYSGKPQVPQSQTVSSSKTDEHNFTSEKTPRDEDDEQREKLGIEWDEIDRLERTVQDMGNEQEDKERGPASLKATVQRNLAKRKK